MDNSTFSFVLIGVVPSACDAEAGEAGRLSTDAPLSETGLACCLEQQSQLTRLFRRFAGQSFWSWNRARIGD